jgi:hypothetical protein
MTMPDKSESLATTWVSPVERQLERWLETELARVGPRVVSRIEVRLMRGGEVARFERIDDPAIFEAGALRLAHAIATACAANLAGSSSETFSVVAFGAAGARSSIRVRIDGDEPPNAEEPTMTGAFEQLLRHNEILLHATLRGSSATNEVLATMNERLLARVADLEEKRQRYVDERDELEGQRHARELEAKQVTARETRRNEMVQHFLTHVAPLIAAHLAGGVPPGTVAGRSQRERLLDTLLVSVAENEAQLGQLAALLTPTQLAMLSELGRGMEHANSPGAAPGTTADNSNRRGNNGE